jgi:nucleoid-associated protein YgaU
MTQGRQALWILIPALCLALGIVLYGWPNLSEQEAQKPAPQTSQPAPATTSPARTGNEAGKAADPLVPVFDIVRVEPTGELVVAGRAGGGAQITLMLDGKAWDQVKADATGQFAMTPPRISAGAHELSLRAQMPDGKSYDSAQKVAIDVPANGGQAVAALLSPDQPAKALLPNGQGVKTAPGQRAPVVIGVVETQPNGAFYVAGQSGPGALVRLYLNDSYVGQGTSTAAGDYSFSVTRGLMPGQYRVRIDEVDPAGNKVLSRAEVVFDYTPPQTQATAPSSSRSGAVEVPEIKSITVNSGDSLWRISSKFYGEGIRYTVIYRANSGQIRDPNLIYPGQVFVVPNEKP